LGLSRFNKTTLRPHTTPEAARDLDIIHHWQQVALRRLGTRMFFASDELYLMAEVGFPPTEAYEGFFQHENGIGMVRALYDEIERLETGVSGEGRIVTGEWRTIPAAPDEGYRAPRHTGGNGRGAPEGPVVLLTGEYGARALDPVRHRLERLANRSIRILRVPNEFFGGNVAVAGLMVGHDVERALAGDAEPAGIYLVPDVALQGDVFLDDVPLADIANTSVAPVVAVQATAAGILEGAAR
jgi:NifB/MoaA-like Fe-S oxidoreductase